MVFNVKLSEYKNEQAIEILGKLLGPVSKIMTDIKVKKLFETKSATKVEMSQVLLANFSHEIIEILAILDDTPVEQYECNVFTLPKKLLEILNDKELSDFFSLQGQNLAQTSFGSAMANTEATEEM